MKIETTLRWLFTAAFLALVLAPAVEFVQRLKWRGKTAIPRVPAIFVVFVFFLVIFTFLVLLVIPPIVHEVKNLAPKLPQYVNDFEDWANQNQQFQDLN